MNRRLLFAAVPAALMLAALPGLVTAATQTTNINVSAGVVDQCVVAGGAGSGLQAAVLDFGARDALASGAVNTQSPSSGSGALQVVCNSSTVTPTLTLGSGAHAGGNSLRRLSGPGAVLVDYALYRDSGHTRFVGATPFALPGITSGVPYVLVLYGRLPTPGQATVEGSYADAVSITVSY